MVNSNLINHYDFLLSFLRNGYLHLAEPRCSAEYSSGNADVNAYLGGMKHVSYLFK
jgi:hypothetical protein